MQKNEKKHDFGTESRGYRRFGARVGMNPHTTTMGGSALSSQTGPPASLFQKLKRMFSATQTNDTTSKMPCLDGRQHGAIKSPWWWQLKFAAESGPGVIRFQQPTVDQIPHTTTKGGSGLPFQTGPPAFYNSLKNRRPSQQD